MLHQNVMDKHSDDDSYIAYSNIHCREKPVTMTMIENRTGGKKINFFSQLVNEWLVDCCLPSDEQYLTS